MRGVFDAGATSEEDAAALKAALLSSLEGCIERFTIARQSEGAALAEILSGQLTAIDELVKAARQTSEARNAATPGALKRSISRVTEVTDAVDSDRLAQELALIAVKADVTEELDRLDAHVVAARDLLKGAGPKGRKLDFLMQEFNREANTLCSKANDTGLTRIGLDLKTVIDQMREQVQNVE